MFQRLKKLFFTPALALLVMVTMSVGLAASAQAAQPTYQPTFSPNQHVYLDPLLENGNPSVNLNGLEQKLIDEGKKHNVDFYFVMPRRVPNLLCRACPSPNPAWTICWASGLAPRTSTPAATSSSI
ncbi:MAG: hypothetical protein IPJ49_12300 [Candidatus Obscuribacter sp.]|nr:hypothetical protein [Candidatus Obscuribacter sp.]